MGGEVIVFGGTFDPVHKGHLAVAEQVLDATGAGAMWFMPAGVPSLHDPPVASVDDRVDMLRAALARAHGFVLRIDEVERPGVSYTADTMRALHRAYPHTEFRMLLGADAARSLRRWERADDLLAGEDFVIVNRAGTPELTAADAAQLGFDTARCELLRIDSPDISASTIRRRAALGLSLKGLVPKAVAHLISERGLYAAPAGHA